MAGAREKANSTNSVSMMLSSVTDAMLVFVGASPPTRTSRVEGVPTPPIGDVPGERR